MISISNQDYIRYFTNDTVSEQISSNKIDQDTINIKLQSLNNLNNINSINNLSKQPTKKECLSEPEGRITSELKQEKKDNEEIIGKRENYQKTTKRNRSKRMFKFKSQSKVDYKLYDSEKITVNLRLI